MKKIIFILIIAIASCRSPNKKYAESISIDLENLQSKVDSIFNEKIGTNEPGVALLIAYVGRMLIGKGYGVRDIESQQPITKSTNMELASLSKQFTALAVLSLVDNGKLSLNDTVYKFYPYETFRDVTVQQLINHTSGIDDAEELFYTDWDSTIVANNNDILEWYTKENRKKNKAGKVYKYNNGAYGVLPLLVEKVSGINFEDYIKENVFEKAGMKRTIVYNLNHPIEIDERAFYYEKNSINQWTKMDGHFITGVLGAGGVYTNINDYFNYDLALRNKTIFSKGAHEQIFKVNSTPKIENTDLTYSMGWMVNDTIAVHSGGWFGVYTYTKRYLDIPLTITIFANRDHNKDFRVKYLFNKVDSLAVKFVNSNYLK